jgi:leucyl aminopeptidase
MQIAFEARPAEAIETEALVSYAFEQDDPVEGLGEFDAATGGQLRKLAASGELTGKPFEMALLHYPAGLRAERLLIVGAGKREKFVRADLRRVAGAALRSLKARGVKRLAFFAREGERAPAAAQAIVEGFLLADVEAEKYKTEKNEKREIRETALAGWPASGRAEVEQAIARARIIAEAQNFARDLANEPSNWMTPTILAQRAEAMAREYGLGAEILDEKAIEALGMGALLGVARGSAEPPRLIVLRYEPSEPRKDAPVVGLVGKAITFDTGGISIKPSKGMEKMKYDMAGGAAMLGTMRAIAQLQPAVKVIAVVPSTENMPGGRAQKPGDVVRAMSGKTIEVVNTDAEGRLILADGLTHAQKLGATHLVDAATLTGAIVVALSTINTGVFGNDEAFTARFLESAREAGERMWRMPLEDDYREMIKSTIADIQNIGTGEGGGAVVGAMFLKEFVEARPWIHLDIAGTAWLDEAKPWSAKGASGVPVRTLVDFLLKLERC